MRNLSLVGISVSSYIYHTCQRETHLTSKVVHQSINKFKKIQLLGQKITRKILFCLMPTVMKSLNKFTLRDFKKLLVNKNSKIKSMIKFHSVLINLKKNNSKLAGLVHFNKKIQNKKIQTCSFSVKINCLSMSLRTFNQ